MKRGKFSKTSRRSGRFQGMTGKKSSETEGTFRIVGQSRSDGKRSDRDEKPSARRQRKSEGDMGSGEGLYPHQSRLQLWRSYQSPRCAAGAPPDCRVRAWIVGIETSKKA